MMGAEHEVARAALEASSQMFVDNVKGISIEEALDAGGGFRSIIGLVKHTAAWTAVYQSFAFDQSPRAWTETDWPRGLRERIERTDDYLRELLAWLEQSTAKWLDSVDEPLNLDESRPVPSGDAWPLREIVGYVAAHLAYHAGEINSILAIRRGEGWEYGEHVEENNISTLGRSVRRPWISDEQVEHYEAEMREAAKTSDS